MKEATGELNATVFVVTVVGFLMAFFYFTVWPILKNNFNRNANCAKAICESCKNKSGCDYVTCHLKGQQETFQCVYKG
jgi:hypothetical protein